MSVLLPPLDLAVDVTDPSGVHYRWDSNDRYGGNRPQNLSFSTKRGDGFADASVTLARRIDRDYVDLHLFDDVAFVGADGSVAYEGRIAAMPRSVQEAHSIGVQCAGWMAHAKDKPFTEIYVDRDLSAWEQTSRARQATLLTNNFGIHSFEATRDSTSSNPALMLRIEGPWTTPFLPVVEPVYDAGPANLVSSVFIWTNAGPITDSTFTLKVIGGASDSNFDVVGSDLWTTGSDIQGYQTVTGGRRFVGVQFSYPTTGVTTQGSNYTMGLRNLAVYGDHGLSLYGDNPSGVFASDVIKHIAGKYCPKLNVTGVQDTTYPIPHLVFKDPTAPYDAFTSVNAFHLWELAVWENKTLTFGPSDRRDYDWEVRLTDFGVSVEEQGDTTDDLANGMIVQFTDVSTGAKNMVTPDTASDLLDTNPDNPASMHGIQRWTNITLSNPTTTDSAVQIGRAALAEFNQPKAPGTINITGHVRDRAGHWQQGWKVRAGDTIAITDHPNDSPRLITETSWNHDSKQLTVTVDSTSKRLDALFDRLGVALSAAGLS